ncbi:hypothetical protein [Aquimonas voraii]|nr:hypothetical protein [Aquimonas voraii]
MPEQIATHAKASIDGILARLRAREQVRGVRCRGVRAVRVLEELGKGPMTTDELAGALRKPRADVEHVLAELQALGMVSSGRLIPGWAGSLIVHRLTEARA